jgi:hypothetical protein
MKKGKSLLLAVLTCLLAGQTAFAAEHLAIVSKDDKAGTIDPSGKVIMPLEFSKVEIQNDESHPVILVEKKGKFGMYDRDGREIIAPKLKKVTAYNEGFLGAKDDQGWSFYDAGGRRLPGDYDEVSYFSEGMAAVKKDGKWGYIDTTGKLVIPAIYKKANAFSEGLAAAKLDKNWVYLRKDGSALSVGKADKVGEFHQGTATIDNSWLFNTQGQRYAKLKKYAYVGNFDENGLAQVGVRRSHRTFLDYISIGWGWGGDWGIGYPGWGWGWGGIGIGWWGGGHHHHHHGWGGGITVYPGGAVRPSSLFMGAINKQGQEVIPTDYQALSEFDDGRALMVDAEGRWGMIDTKGQTVVPAMYDKLGFFNEGRAAFSFDDHWGFINESNVIVIPNHFSAVTAFSDGRAAVKTGDKVGIIDASGQFVMNPSEKYNDMGSLHANRLPVKDKESGKWGYLDGNGQNVIKPQYDEAGNFD